MIFEHRSLSLTFDEKKTHTSDHGSHINHFDFHQRCGLGRVGREVGRETFEFDISVTHTCRYTHTHVFTHFDPYPNGPHGP